MYARTVLDAAFIVSVAVIWFMVGYQAVLFFKGHRFFERMLRSGTLRLSVPDSELPAVSVLIPCHNEDLVIRDTIRSILALEYPPERIEVLMIDDGSTEV